MPILSPLVFSSMKFEWESSLCLFQGVGWHGGGRWRAICSHLCHANRVAKGKVCALSFRETNPAVSHLEQAMCPEANGRKEQGWALGPRPEHHRENHSMLMYLTSGSTVHWLLNLTRPFPMALREGKHKGKGESQQCEEPQRDTRQRVWFYSPRNAEK